MRRSFPQHDWRPGRPFPNRPNPRHDTELELRRRGSAATKSLTPKDIEALIAVLPSPPDKFFVYPSGLVAARLYFQQYRTGLDTVVSIWSSRLAGSHLLTPVIVSGFPVISYRADIEGCLKPVFIEHVRSLFNCEAACWCEGRIEQVAGEIRKVSVLLRKPKKMKQADELREKRKRLQDEMGLLESKLGEFRSAIRCILACLGDECDTWEGEEEGAVAVFDLGKEMEWNRLHCLMVRECRRLDDGLPIYAYRRKILKCIGANQVMVLVGETGSGKSTQLVQFLADSGVASGSIICTQPRKVAAISLAQRVREESEGCYTDNFVMSRLAASNSQIFGSGVIYMTDHYLLQHCISNTSFRGISYIVVDEAHERSLNTDLLLALIKKTLLQRCDLRLIIMSATADASKLSEYFYGCCTFYVMGRTFPVEIKYVPDVSAETWTTLPKVSTGNCASYVSDIIKMVCMIHKKEGDGAILAFLTSQMEVEWACECFSDPTAVVLPMHGKLSYEEQSRVFQSYPGKRKVIFSTNVSETSLTIRGVKYVVDSGMVKDCRFEPSTGMNVLKVERISQSSANQRAGRAGRTESGKCYRLYTESEFKSMNMHQELEIRKVHLGIAVLRILALGVKSV